MRARYHGVGGRYKSGFMRALVIGAGIGGITAATALHRAGVHVVVLERRPDAKALQVGGGMVIWHNAVRALRKLDLDIEDVGMPIAGLDWHSARGEPLGSWPVDTMDERLGVRAVGVTRAALYPKLLASMPEGALQTGSHILRYGEDGKGVQARLAGGEHWQADVLVGADGLDSTVRRQLHGQESPRHAGYALDFGIVDLDHPALRRGFHEYDGRGARFICFPVSQGRWYWCCIYRRSARGLNPTPLPKAELLALYHGWPEPVETLIETTDERAIFARDGFDRKPVARWGEGPVTLLGDAAHPMTPNLGQGACQAIEDSVVLGRCLEDASDPVSALREYERRRIDRSAYFVKRSHMIGAIGRWQNPLACKLRDSFQKRLVPGVAFREHFEKVRKEI